ncbi:DUF3307 domain-containing protein [Marinilabilia salmonicolor]|jgi:hypothetical protein|uniref:Uncharacterized protein DUF3307 n=1 Tax=Marinilabilia salmonicolor TaxID=989 RepID=A0A368VE03_9BACT|nr:DUF3307 domain-containing protein [Marinilabilia salmonicolor]RCW38943.1 uncharacterized protein DUF3307 [Marinilabilia salmonicolor]
MITLALKLLIVHFLADFAMQPDSWVVAKNKNRQKSPFLYYHVGIHVLLLLVVFQFDWSYWPLFLVYTLSHFTFDLAKLFLNGRLNPRFLFAIDQVAHLTVILLLVGFYHSFPIDWDALFSSRILLMVATLLALTSVSSVIIKQMMSRWNVQSLENDESLKNAGKYIGMLERLFIFGFILLHQWQAIGFLIAAKSIFRFSDLSRAKDRKLTEYMIIGTFISFGLALLTSVLYLYVADAL